MLGRTVVAVVAMASSGVSASYLAFMPRCWKACSREAGLMCNWGDLGCICQAANRGVLANANSCACSKCGDTDFKVRLDSDLSSMAYKCRMAGVPLSPGVARAVSDGAECPAPASASSSTSPLDSAPAPPAPAPGPAPPAIAPAPAPPAPLSAQAGPNPFPGPKVEGPESPAAPEGPIVSGPAVVNEKPPTNTGNLFSGVRHRIEASLAGLAAPHGLSANSRGRTTFYGSSQLTAQGEEDVKSPGANADINVEESANKKATQPIISEAAAPVVTLAGAADAVLATPTVASVPADDFAAVTLLNSASPAEVTLLSSPANISATVATEASPTVVITDPSTNSTSTNSTTTQPKPAVHDAHQDMPIDPPVVSLVQTVLVTPVPVNQVAQLAQATPAPSSPQASSPMAPNNNGSGLPSSGSKPGQGAAAKPGDASAAPGAKSNGANAASNKAAGSKNSTSTPAVFTGAVAKLEMKRPLTAMGLIAGLVFGFA